MAVINETRVREALAAVKDPARGGDLVSLGMISGIAIRDAHVQFSIEIDAARAAAFAPIQEAARRAVAAIPGVLSATALLTGAKRPAPAAPKAPAAEALLPDVRAIVAVASGKGGVGKSTTATNLAVALAEGGARVGLLDADIYGPSQPRLMGITGRPRPISETLMAPLEAHGVKVMSIGFLIGEEQAMVWRGPMVMGALKQLIGNVAWGALDVMIVDMPPGTGDAQLTLAQSVPLAGAVIVSTPQDIALIDARRGIAMFERVQVPVLGVVENMSYFACPHCGERTEIFSHGGARATAERLGVPFLGELPLDLRIRETSDAGTPIVAADPASPQSAAYRAIAERLSDRLATPRRPAPRLVME